MTTQTYILSHAGVAISAMPGPLTVYCECCEERIESAYAEDCANSTCDGAECYLAENNGCGERDAD